MLLDFRQEYGDMMNMSTSISTPPITCVCVCGVTHGAVVEVGVAHVVFERGTNVLLGASSIAEQLRGGGS
jgi:hypothetical protein